jgi:hypothetical protein
MLGDIGGIAVDSRDHVWVYQRPRSLTEDERGAANNPPSSKCCRPAPPVLEFDPDGNLVSAWGGPGAGYEWPEREHGIFVDAKDQVWIAGNGNTDAHVLQFTRDGRFVQQIGRAGRISGSNSPTDLGRPAIAIVDTPTGDLYIADGYANRRVLVLDAATGAYKRHWGAYGNRPDDTDLGKYDPAAPPAKQFRGTVHCVRISNDGLVYVCDRLNNRVQIFQRDGSFVKEYFLEPKTLHVGSVWDIAFSEDAKQRYMYIADGTNNEVHILLRERVSVSVLSGAAAVKQASFTGYMALPPIRRVMCIPAKSIAANGFRNSSGYQINSLVHKNRDHRSALLLNQWQTTLVILIDGNAVETLKAFAVADLTGG